MLIFYFKQFIVHLFFPFFSLRVFFVFCSLNPSSCMSFCCVSIESGDDDESDSDLLFTVDIIERVEWSVLSSSSPSCCRSLLSDSSVSIG